MYRTKKTKEETLRKIQNEFMRDVEKEIWQPLNEAHNYIKSILPNDPRYN